MFRANQANYVYRPVLLERPSMWRFVLLSLLLHVWLVVLFGDASGGRRDSASWSRTFFATLERGAPAKTDTPGTRDGAAQSRPTPVVAAPSPSPAPAPAKVSEDVAASPNKPTTEVASSSASALSEVPAPLKPIEIEKIPAIAVEVSGAVTPFSVAPIVVEPLSPAVSSTAPAILSIAPLRSNSAPAVRVGEAGFAIYVPPIVERAAVSVTPAPILATPTLPPLAKPQVELEFATYVAPPVVPTVPAPSVAIDAMAVPTPSVVAPAAPAVQIAAPRPVEVVPIAPEPIAPLTLSPATKALETYQPRAVDAPTTPAASTSVAVPTRDAAASAAQTPGKAPGSATATAATVPPSPVGVGASAVLNSPLPLPPPSVPAPTTPSPLPSATTPRLDLDQLRRQARDAARDGAGSRALLPFPMVAKEVEKKDMEKIFDKALKRPDCKEVYADLGLLAVVPLLRDAAKDGGCKW